LKGAFEAQDGCAVERLEPLERLGVRPGTRSSEYLDDASGIKARSAVFYFTHACYSASFRCISDAQGEEIVKAITLRNLPAEVEKVVRKEAERQRTSINKAVISLLERKTQGHKKRQQVSKEYDDLDRLAGSWTKKEAAEFDKALAAQRTIDPDLWK
jgi:hypothetical protein